LIEVVLETVHVPTSVDDALAALGDSSRVIAGGTTIMPVVNTQPLDFAELVSLRRAGLSGIKVEGGVAVVGATTTIAELGADARLAFLQQVVDTFASPPLRNLATVGGNLFVPQPGGDLAVCLLALGATVEIVGSDGARDADIAEVLADGVHAGEIVTAVRFPLPEPGSWFYTKAMRRRFNSAAIVTVAAVVVAEDGVVRSARIALGGAGARPVRATHAEDALTGKPFDPATVETAGAAALADAETFDDAYASAWYRARVLPVHFRRALLGE
jgi:CO/xanthine dehydrogenase FAD-binding subunit